MSIESRPSWMALAVSLVGVACADRTAHEPSRRGESETRRVALNDASLGPATKVTAGYYHSCALLATGRVACWGSGGHGELGNGAKTGSDLPLLTDAVTDAVDVSAGAYKTCAVRATGAVVCWGWNGLGQPSFGQVPTTVTIPDLTDATQVSVAAYHTCAVRQTGEVACWGDGVWGKLGNGSTDDSEGPVPVSGLTDAVTVAAGYYHTCALRSSGRAVCWGRASAGALGNAGNTGDSSVPVDVANITDAIGIGVGNLHGCVVRATGNGACWGAGTDGQLGFGFAENFSKAVNVSVGELSDGVAIAAGGRHTCAIRNGGQALCWGKGDEGVLGNGSTESVLVPTPVTGLTDAVMIATGGTGLGTGDGLLEGGDHSCAVRANGSIVCWGANALGNGASGGSLVPVAVSDIGAIDGLCTSGVQCASGFCVDGFCCDSACGGGDPNDCQVCSVAAGGAADGTCSPRASGSPCGQEAVCATPATCSGSSSVCPAPTPIPACSAGSVAPGTNVSLEFNGGLSTVGGMLILFTKVDESGNVTVVEKNTSPPPLDEFGTLPSAPPRTWDIDTTAGYTPPIVICVAYAQSWFADYVSSNPTKNECTLGGVMEDECNLKLIHYHTGDAGFDVLPDPPPELGLPGLDTVNNIVCAQTTSLSPFALAVRLDKLPPVFAGVPGPITAFATSTQGAVVSYPTPTATDGFDGERPVTCLPASGAQFPVGQTNVTCSTADSRGNTNSAAFTVWVQYQAPTDGSFFLPPINPDGSSIFKRGSTVPVKFRLKGASAGVAGLAARLFTAKVANSVSGTYVEADSTAACDDGNRFRYDAGDRQYVFNLSTKAMTIGTWSLRADLGDGVEHVIRISLR